MPSGPDASVTPGCHSRKTSGCLGATITGRAVTAPCSRSFSVRRRASYSPRTGQQKASFAVPRPGNERRRWPSMRCRNCSRVEASRRSRAAMSRTRSAFLQDLMSSMVMPPCEISSPRLPDRSRLSQARDLRLGQPRLAQNGIRVLAERGRRRADLARRPVEANRRVERAETPGARVLLLDEEPARGDLRVARDVGVAVDRRAEDVVSFEARHPNGKREGAEGGGEQDGPVVAEVPRVGP